MRIRKSWGYGFCVLAGLSDVITGALLIAAPLMTLRLMHIHAVPAEPVYMRFIGAFVGAAGCMLLLPFAFAAGPRRDRMTEGILAAATTVRVIIAIFSATAVASGALAAAWLSVTFTDALVAAVQIALLRFGTFRSGDA